MVSLSINRKQTETTEVEADTRRSWLMMKSILKQPVGNMLCRRRNKYHMMICPILNCEIPRVESSAFFLPVAQQQYKLSQYTQSFY
jgi:hypothetical protein